MTGDFADPQGIPPKAEQAEALDAMKSLLEGNMTRVVLRYVGE